MTIPLTEHVDAADGTTPEALLERYQAALRRLVDDFGAEHVGEGPGVDRATVEAIEAGDAGDLDLRDVAAVLALREGAPDGEAVLSTVRDHLLLEMSTGMLTVDRVAAAVEDDLEPKEVQGQVEGRLPMTLAEYARLHHAIAAAT